MSDGAPPERSSTGPRKSKKQPQMAQTARSERSVMSDGAPKRRTLVLEKQAEQGGEWDQIVQYNQREGRRIASMAQVEIQRKKEENKQFLDQQVQEHERRRKKEER